MNIASFASAAFSTLGPRAWRKPSRCPYCPGYVLPHWTGWGSYSRYGGDPDEPSKRIAIPRCRCKIVCRTFSLLPDPLLPYCNVRTVFILDWLHALIVRGVGLNTLARHVGVTRGTLRYLKGRFLRVLPKLRLPGHEGALAPVDFMTNLADMDCASIADIFGVWKEREPKFSITGIYLRC